MYTVTIRLRLKKDRKFIMSNGRYELLRLVEKYRSLSRATKGMGMSYRHGWGILKKMEKAAGKKIIVSRRGGNFASNTMLTPFGKKLLSEYENYLELINKAISEKKKSIVLD